MKTFRALSALLGYPSAELQQAIPEIREVLHGEGLLGPRCLAGFEPLMHRLAEADLYDVQEDYVLLFDRSRSLSLNLFEHVHGESRDRGGAMVDLLETYRAGGYDLVGGELPDHLPVLLEFLSTQTLNAAQAILADAGPILMALSERLQRRESLYAPVLAALPRLAAREPEEALVAALLAEEMDDPEDLPALDAVWNEAQVMFGPDPNAGCPVSRDILARMDLPAGAPARAPAP